MKKEGEQNTVRAEREGAVEKKPFPPQMRRRGGRGKQSWVEGKGHDLHSGSKSYEEDYKPVFMKRGDVHLRE